MKMEQQRKLFWREFVETFMLEIKNKFQQGPKPFKEAQENIYNRIISTLVTFLDNYILPTIVDYITGKKQQCPATENTSQHYNSLFENGLEATLEILHNHYSPVMAAIYNRCRLFTVHFTQCCDRIFADWEEIKAKFHIEDEDILENVRFFTGDVHGNGEQTTLVIFNKGAKGFAYKASDLSVIQFFYEILAFIKDRFNFSFKKIPEILLKKDSGHSKYGYIDFVTYQGSVQSTAEAEAVYENFGKLLAFARFFKVADGHSDNVVIQAPNVFWIDLENAFHFAPPELLENFHHLETTGLLYEAKKNTTLFGIFTGIQAGTLPRISLTQPLAHNEGTDEMYIRYFAVMHVPKEENRNRIYLHDKLCLPEDYAENIKKGYSDTLRILIIHKNEILKFIRDYLQRNKVVVRYIFKSTACYNRCLNLIEHTVALTQGDVLQKIRHELLALTVEKSPFKEFIIEHELKDICNDVIPFFYKTSTDRNIYHSSGLCMHEFFDKTLIDEYSETIEKLELAEIETDLAFIDRALQSTHGLDNWETFKNKFDYPELNYAALKSHYEQACA